MAGYSKNVISKVVVNNAINATNATNATNAVSASYAITASYAMNGGGGTTTGSFTGSFTGSLLGTASLALTASYFSGSISNAVNSISASYALTASYFSGSISNAVNATSASYAATASLAPNYVLNSVTSSFVTNSQTSSFVTNSQTGSFTTTSSFSFFTGSYNTGSFTGSFTGSLLGTASQATSASYALTASYALNSAGTPGGTNTQIQFNSASVFSGSSKLTYNYITSSLTLTGSLNITGSTTQVGNNTLLGNTLLSGSITISGSSGPGSATASVQIYGDIRQSGYHRFDPVTTNIDTTTSASYIYVSGSTNDLYFSQNGSGYNNVTRLRWLEGGALYTGILRGGVLSSTPGTTTFNITSGSGLIVTMNASTGSEPFPISQYISWPNYTSQPITYSGSAQITYVGIKSDGTIQQQTVPWGSLDIDQWDNSISLGIVLTLSGSVSTGVFNAPQISYGGFQKTDDFFRAFGPLKTSGHTLRASGSATLGLIQDAGSSYREGANYVINANHPSTVIENNVTVSKIYRYHLSGSTPVIDTGTLAAGYTEIDPTKRVDTTTGLLTSVSINKYSLQRVFWFPNSPTQAFIVYYGNAEYNSLIDAVNAKDSEPFTEAPNTALNAIFLGYIAVAGGATAGNGGLQNAINATIVQGGIFRSVGGVGSSGTNFVSTTLAGLADVSLSNNTPGDLLVYGTSNLWNNKKQLTGSYGLTGSLTVTQNVSASSFTGSLFGTASWATNAITSSYIVTAQTASYVLNAVSSSYAETASLAPNYVLNSATSSFVTNSQTSSFVQNSQTSSMTVLSSSYAATASYVLNSGVTQIIAGTNISISPTSGTGSVTISSTGGGGGGVTKGFVIAMAAAF